MENLEGSIEADVDANVSPLCRGQLHQGCKGSWVIWFAPETVPDKKSPHGRNEVCACECHIRRELVTIEDIEADRAGVSPAEFRRQYINDPVPKPKCWKCHRAVRVRNDGLVVAHKLQRRGWQTFPMERCPGSRTLPE